MSEREATIVVDMGLSQRSYGLCTLDCSAVESGASEEHAGSIFRGKNNPSKL
jgi:hypothetical protein